MGFADGQGIPAFRPHPEQGLRLRASENLQLELVVWPLEVEAQPTRLPGGSCRGSRGPCGYWAGGAPAGVIAPLLLTQLAVSGASKSSVPSPSLLSGAARWVSEVTGKQEDSSVSPDFPWM